MVYSLLDIIRAEREMIVAAEGPDALPPAPDEAVSPSLAMILDVLLAYWDQGDEQIVQAWVETQARQALQHGLSVHTVVSRCNLLAQRLRSRLQSHAVSPMLFCEASAQLDASMALLYRTYLEAYATCTAPPPAPLHTDTQAWQRSRELEILYDLSQQVGYTLEYNDLVRRLLEHLPRIVPHDMSASILATGGLCHLYIRPLRPLSTMVQEEIQRRLLYGLMRMRGYMSELKPENLHLHVLNAQTSATPRPPMARLDSFFQVPLIVGQQHETIGLLCVGAEHYEAFSEAQVRLFYTVANQAALSLQRLRTLLAETQQQLEHILEHLPNGVLLIDTNRRLVVANPIAKAYLPSLTDIDIGGLLLSLGEYPLEPLLHPAPVGHHHEIEVAGPPPRVFEVDARPVGESAAAGWVLVLRDVTEDRRARARAQQQERLATVGQLAAGIAHDFNNLLSGIIGFASLLQDRADIPASARQALSLIAQQGERGAHMVRQILDFSRASVSLLHPVNLQGFLTDAVAFLRNTIPENLHMTLDLTPGEHTVRADVTRLQQVLTNLVLNARDASPAGGELRLRLTHFTQQLDEPSGHPEVPPGEWEMFAIADTGTGIPADILPHIFEPFFTTKAPGQGSGLGLAQVYGIIKQHEGYIHIDSQVGVGTTITIYLPAFLSQPESVPVLLSPSRETQRLQGHGETVLLVEDEPMVLEVSRSMLAALQYDVLTAANGQQALDIYRRQQERIALVLTDMLMPEMDGMALCTALRQINPHVKVILMTGYPLADKGKRILSQGFLGWLQKPLQLSHLAQVIQQVLAE